MVLPATQSFKDEFKQPKPKQQGLFMCFPCCSSKPKMKPQDSALVKTTPITPELIEKAQKMREEQQKVEKVVNNWASNGN